MKRKPNIFKALTLVLFLLTIVACDSTNDLKVETAAFSVNNDSVYLTKSITFTASDSLGGNEYAWDFGDGNKLMGRYNVTHTYEKGGQFTATLTINGFKSSKAITVYKGTVSFRIINQSNEYINFLTYIDNYLTGNVNRFNVQPKSNSNTIYCINSSTTQKHILGISLFINNSEYMLEDILWISDFEHHDIIVTDETKVHARSYSGNPNIVMIKDL